MTSGTRGTPTDALVVHLANPVLAIHPDTDAITALKVMQDFGVRHLPVVLGNRCEGLVTETDLLRALAMTTRPELPAVRQLRHRHPPAVADGAPTDRIAAAILAGGLGAALVVHDGALTGIVTSTDVLAAVAAT